MDTMTYASFGALRAIIAQKEQTAPVSEPELTPLDVAQIKGVS
jgi:hypothetical protein